MEQNTEESLLELNVDYDSGNILKDTARWTRFISVTGMIGIGFFLLVLLIAGSALLALFSQTLPGIQAFAGVIVGAVIVVFGIMGVMVYVLFRFSSLTRKGLETQNQEIFNQGLNGLKIFFIINGVLALIGLFFNLLSLTNLF